MQWKKAPSLLSRLAWKGSGEKIDCLAIIWHFEWHEITALLHVHCCLMIYSFFISGETAAAGLAFAMSHIVWVLWSI